LVRGGNAPTIHWHHFVEKITIAVDGNFFPQLKA
jgi:hypothetical protein